MAHIKVINRQTGETTRHVQLDSSTCEKIDEIAGNMRCAINIDKEFLEVNYDNAIG